MLSLLQSWANSFAAFLYVSNSLWTRTVLLREGESSFKTVARFQSLLESFFGCKEAVFSHHFFFVCRRVSVVN